MSNEAPKRTRCRSLYVVLIGLAATIMGLGMPGLLSASDTIDCNGTLIAATPTINAHLGGSVSASGDWLAAGAIQDNTKPGFVALYSNPGARTDRHPDQEIVAGDPHPGDQFGTSVSISNSISGYWLAVGAPAGNGRVQDSGVVYIFQLKNGAWSQQAKLEAADAARGAQFGFSVSLNASLNGATLVVGAPSDSGGGSLAGAAYVFELQSGTWNQTAKLLANDFRPFDEFGSAVATDGGEIVVGAPFADDLTVFKNFGAAYVFKRAGSGWTLEDQGKLTAGPFRAGNIQFGSAVAIGGSRIGVGAPGDDNQGFSDSGSAYVFERQGSGWLRRQLKPEDPRESVQFGTAVQIDGDSIVIGAPFAFDREGVTRVGASYLFEQSNDVWIQKLKILHTPGGAFGQSVAALGNQVFMGGYLYDGPFGESSVTDAGAVATCPTGVQPSCAASISKTDQQDTVQQGQIVTYQIDVKAALPGATVNDSFPQKLEAVGWCRGNACTNFVQQPLADPLPAGGDATYRLRGRVGAEATGNLTNTACVNGGACSQTCATDTDQIQAIEGPKPFCVKTGPETAEPGGTVTYEVTVGNDGGLAAHGVILEDRDPQHLHFVSATAPCSGGFPCELGTIAAGQTLPPVNVTFQVDVPLDCSVSGPTVENVATVGDAECSAQTRIVPPQADLALVVSNIVPAAPVACGTAFSFSLTASNLGPAVAKGAVVDVTVVGAVSLTTSEPGCALVPGPQPHLRCTGLPDLPDLSPAGPGHTITFSAKAPACGPGCAAVTINATVQSGNTCDPNPQNDTVIQVVPVSCSPVADLAITKIHDPAVLAPGQAMAYVLTVRNNGPSDVPGTTVTDSLPNALLSPHCVGANRLDCTFLGNNLNIAVGPLPVGSEAVYRIEGQLTSQCISILSNTATVSPAPGIVDPDLSNNTATDTTAVQSPPGVSIHCSGVSDAFEGDFVTFTYVLTNGGPNAQADNPGAEFTDTLPAGLTLVTATASSGTVTTAANTVSWNGSIPVCGTVTINVQATVNAGTAGTTLCSQGTVFFDADGDGIDESNASDTCCVSIHATPKIPTLGPAGLAALVILLACVALLRLRRRSL
ncbi:MAG TPA: hypothetical protein VLX28_08925 [Thermoanaerobaculia bacterium]|nr:hypothetical protein [Thermoanaerobaculia bacterium]